MKLREFIKHALSQGFTISCSINETTFNIGAVEQLRIERNLTDIEDARLYEIKVYLDATIADIMQEVVV